MSWEFITLSYALLCILINIGVPAVLVLHSILEPVTQIDFISLKESLYPALKITTEAQLAYFESIYTYICNNCSPDDVKPVKELIKYLGTNFQSNEWLSNLQHRLLACQAQTRVDGKCSINLLDLAKVLKLEIEAFNSTLSSPPSIVYSPSLPSLSLDCRSRLDPSIKTFAMSANF
jgi:hypothetical protein